MQAGSPVEAFAGENSYSRWRSAVDERLQGIYCITVEDAGFDEDYLTHHWQSGEPANRICGTVRQQIRP
jgi:hypothetical protein